MNTVDMLKLKVKPLQDIYFKNGINIDEYCETENETTETHQAVAFWRIICTKEI